MKGLRIFERFGFDLPQNDMTKIIPSCVVQDYCEWIFHPEYFDWLNVENGHNLTDYRKSYVILMKIEINGIASIVENAKVYMMVFTKAVIQSFNHISITYSGKLCHGDPN
ncbi:MAG: hypothetical protein JWR54_209 [Mucilaginibacter sp.]|nr:hypothetical protein [Mucilaginibacter sp.]